MSKSILLPVSSQNTKINLSNKDINALLASKTQKEFTKLAGLEGGIINWFTDLLGLNKPGLEEKKEQLKTLWSQLNKDVYSNHTTDEISKKISKFEQLKGLAEDKTIPFAIEASTSMFGQPQLNFIVAGERILSLKTSVIDPSSLTEINIKNNNGCIRCCNPSLTNLKQQLSPNAQKVFADLLNIDFDNIKKGSPIACGDTDGSAARVILMGLQSGHIKFSNEKKEIQLLCNLLEKEADTIKNINNGANVTTELYEFQTDKDYRQDLNTLIDSLKFEESATLLVFIGDMIHDRFANDKEAIKKLLEKLHEVGATLIEGNHEEQDEKTIHPDIARMIDGIKNINITLKKHPDLKQSENTEYTKYMVQYGGAAINNKDINWGDFISKVFVNAALIDGAIYTHNGHNQLSIDEFETAFGTIKITSADDYVKQLNNKNPNTCDSNYPCYIISENDFRSKLQDNNNRSLQFTYCQVIQDNKSSKFYQIDGENTPHELTKKSEKDVTYAMRRLWYTPYFQSQLDSNQFLAEENLGNGVYVTTDNKYYQVINNVIKPLTFNPLLVRAAHRKALSELNITFPEDEVYKDKFREWLGKYDMFNVETFDNLPLNDKGKVTIAQILDSMKIPDKLPVMQEYKSNKLLSHETYNNLFNNYNESLNLKEKSELLERAFSNCKKPVENFTSFRPENKTRPHGKLEGIRIVHGHNGMANVNTKNVVNLNPRNKYGIHPYARII